jgi:hypothetical protein
MSWKTGLEEIMNWLKGLDIYFSSIVGGVAMESDMV